MVLKLISRKLIQLTLATFTVLVSGCGGGTSGTGGVTVEGRLIDNFGAPVSSAQVTLLESGETVTTDSQGGFEIIVSDTEKATFEIIENKLVVQSEVSDIPKDVERVVVTFTVDKEKKTVSHETKRKEDTSSEDENEGPKSPNDSSGGGGDDNSDKGDGPKKPSGDTADDNSDQGGSNSSSDSSGNGSAGSDDGDNGTDNSNDDGQDDSSDGREVEVSGVITQASATQVTLAGQVFIVTERSQIKNAEGKKISPSELQLGSTAEAKGRTRDGVTELEKLEVKTNND